MNPEVLLRIVIYVPAVSFFIWTVWVLDERHPDRLDQLRRWLGINETP